MGGDGGSKPSRVDEIKTKPKEEVLDPAVTLGAKWLYCSLSAEELRVPVVACDLGRLYNKDALIDNMLKRAELDEHKKSQIKHIKSLKDIHTLNLTASEGSFVCPITGDPMNGKHGFIFFRTCGCVLSRRAMKEAKSISTCFKCGKEFSVDDVITLNPPPEEEAVLHERMISRKASTKSKDKVKDQAASDGNTTSSSSLGQKRKGEAPAHAHKTTKLSVVAEVSDALNKRLGDNAHQSDAYKSLFTSSSKPKPSSQYAARTTFTTF